MDHEMMIDYTPDNWVLLQIEGLDWPNIKVLAGWSGGYLDGDSWRMSSGITDIERYQDYYLVTNASGSVYKLRPDANMVRMNIAETYNIMKSSPGVEEIDLEDAYREIHGPED